MRVATRFALCGGLAVGVLATLACENDITTPGPCPAFCPSGRIEVVDTMLTGVVEHDTSFTGYVEATVATGMQVVGGGAPIASHGLIWFFPFGDSAAVDSIVRAPVVEMDSFRLDLVLIDRSPDVSGLELNVHRIPPDAERLGSYDSFAPYFEDSTVVGVVEIPDGVTEDTIETVLPLDAFPEFETNEKQVAVGLSIRGGTPAFANFRTRETRFAALLNRFVRVEYEGDTLERTDFKTPAFDGFVHPDLADAAPGSLLIGGTPSSRAFFRVNLPPAIIDSAEIVRAQLLLVPVEPVLGAPSDTIRVLSEAVSTDFGAKSPILPEVDSLVLKTPVGVGSSDTVAVDISRILAFWQRNPVQVRTLIVRFHDEAASVAELRVGSIRFAGMAPALRVTFVPPFSFGQ
jgi:hypothetical protein